MKNNNGHILNMFSAVLSSAMEAAVTRSEDNELRRMMRRTECTGEILNLLGGESSSAPALGGSRIHPASVHLLDTVTWERDHAKLLQIR